MLGFQLQIIGLKSHLILNYDSSRMKAIPRSVEERINTSTGRFTSGLFLFLYLQDEVSYIHDLDWQEDAHRSSFCRMRF